MPIRRAADPITVQHVWDAIRCLVLQHQMADTKRIIKYLQRVDKCTYAQADLYVNQVQQDGLIVALPKLTGKGEQTESFRIPTKEYPDLDGIDWYCFECHLAGDVTACQGCFRVFHFDCINVARRKFDEFKRSNTLSPPNKTNNDSSIITNKSVSDFSQNSLNVSDTEVISDSSINDASYNKVGWNNNIGGGDNGRTGDVVDDSYDETLCSMCNISNLGSNCELEPGELNYLLKFVIHRIQSWLPNTITHTMAEEDRPEWLTDKELTWRSNQLFFEHRDMSVIEVNINNESYKSIQEFYADVLTIQHNVAIFHGIESQEYGAAELMVRDCVHDLAELKICVDCYRHSNEKMNAKWFCLPCRVPHTLVWAKQKGYPYWPAKVIRETDTHFDVRFFGGKYERSLLAKPYVKPIDTPKDKLQIKPSSAFNKSVEELRMHQRLLKNPVELQRLIESSKLKMRNLAKNKMAALKATKSPNNSTLNIDNNVRKSTSDLLDNNTYQCADGPYGQNSSREVPKRKNHSYDGVPMSKKRPLTDREGNARTDEAAAKSFDSVIDISDGDDEHAEFSFRDNFSVGNLDANYEQVSSSTENYKCQEPVVTHQNEGIQKLDHPYSDSVEKMRRRLESLTDKGDIIKCAMNSMQAEIDRITNDHNEHLKRLFESHNAQISETKKKQWCYNCEQDAIYHCCWNTAYCSQSCQQQHWQAEHKKVCRRKR